MSALDNAIYNAYSKEVSAYSNVMFGLGLFFILTIPPLLFLHRNHPLLKARQPYICITEVLIVLILLIFTSSQNSNYLWRYWFYCPCWLYNAVESAISAVLWNVTAARLLLFYRSAQVNTWDYDKKNVWLDRFVHYFGVANCPLEFSRNEVRLAILAREQKSSIGLSHGALPEEGTPNLHSFDSHLDSIHKEHKKEVSLYATWKEPLQWYAKILLWFLLWAALIIVVTYAVTDFYTGLGLSDSCINVSTSYIEAQLIFWNILQCGIALTWIGKPTDSLGLKTELIVTQTCFLLIWIPDAIQILVAPQDYSTSGVYFDLLAMLLHALLAGFYPIIFIYYRKWSQARILNQLSATSSNIARSSNNLSTIAALPRRNSRVDEFALEKLWSDSTGRALVMDVVAQSFAVEQTLFLESTDSMDRFTQRRMNLIFQRYICQEAPFEINIEWKLRNEWAAALAHGKFDQTECFRIVEYTRKQVFRMLSQNYGQQILIMTKRNSA